MSPARIEGAIIDVCDRCSKFGTKADAPQNTYNAVKKTINVSDLGSIDLQLIPEYGKVIVKIREDKGLTRYDFARKINEKESVIKRIEDQKFKPDEKLVERIENFLDINLRENPDGSFLRQRVKKRIDLAAGA